MIIKAHAKINWDLYITSLREDGYHELDSVMQPIALHDLLSVCPAKTASLAVSGPYAGGVPTDERNLALRAAALFAEAACPGLRTEIRIEKNIPHGAGLGGGSTDAAAVLKGCNALAGNPLTAGELSALALKLGADVPLCLTDRAHRARGVGEKLEEFPMPERIPLLLIMGKERLNTGEVYRLYDRMDIPFDRERMTEARGRLARGDLAAFSALAGNMLMPPALTLAEDLNAHLADLKSLGAIHAAMTGSGAAVFGVFTDKKTAAQARTALEEKFPVCILTETGTGY